MGVDAVGVVVAVVVEVALHASPATTAVSLATSLMTVGHHVVVRLMMTVPTMTISAMKVKSYLASIHAHFVSHLVGQNPEAER